MPAPKHCLTFRSSLAESNTQCSQHHKGVKFQAPSRRHCLYSAQVGGAVGQLEWPSSSSPSQAGGPGAEQHGARSSPLRLSEWQAGKAAVAGSSAAQAPALREAQAAAFADRAPDGDGAPAAPVDSGARWTGEMVDFQPGGPVLTDLPTAEMVVEEAAAAGCGTPAAPVLADPLKAYRAVDAAAAPASAVLLEADRAADQAPAAGAPATPVLTDLRKAEKMVDRAAGSGRPGFEGLRKAQRAVDNAAEAGSGAPAAPLRGGPRDAEGMVGGAPGDGKPAAAVPATPAELLNKLRLLAQLNHSRPGARPRPAM